MFYFFSIGFAVICYFVFRSFVMKKNRLKDADIKAYYRFQEHPGQYSGSLRSTNGAIVFHSFRYQDHVNYLVIRDVKISDPRIVIKLQQIIVLPFKAGENNSSEASVRFRVASTKASAVDLRAAKVRITGLINYDDGEKKAYSITIKLSDADLCGSENITDPITGES